MIHYETRIVTAPAWMKDFHCIISDCPEICCQQWNIDVDPVHAEYYTHIDDPELQAIMDRLLRSFHIKRPGMRKPLQQHRLMLLNQPDKRCPLLDRENKCRLQKKYGAEILCDTCYFHPRTFWQIDDQTGLSACLSCPECARLALLSTEPVSFTQFETEIDPNAEWLETSLIEDPGVRLLLVNRDRLVFTLCGILQDRALPFPARMLWCRAFLKELSKQNQPDEEAIQSAYEASRKNVIPQEAPEDPAETIRLYLDVFDPISEGMEKPAQEAAELTRILAGGREGLVQRIAGIYAQGAAAASSFFAENTHLIENFMVHYVFSDSFKQFYRYQNGPVSVPEVLRHEAALLETWHLLIRVRMAQAAFEHGSMDEDLFLQTVIHADKTWWHYPDWFGRCAERYMDLSDLK